MPLESRGSPALLHDLEQHRLLALVGLLARPHLHRAAARVGLHAAVRPHGHVRPSLLTTMWPISPAAAAAVPELAVEHDPAADARAPEHAEQRVGTACRRRARTPPSVATLTSLASPIGAPNAASSFSRERYEPSQSGRLRALVTVPASSSIAPGEPTPTAVQARRARRRPRSAASRIAPTIASVDVGRAALGRGRHGAPSRAPRVLVDHHRLDLRAAEVDAAVPCHCSFSLPLTRPRERVARRPRFPRNRTAEAGEQLLGVPALRAGAARRPPGGRAGVGVGLRRRRASARARTSPGARPATRPRRPTRAARAVGAVGGRAARSRGRTRRSRRGRIVARVRIATGRRRGGAGARRPRAGRVPPHAPCDAQRRQPHGVALRAQRAPAGRRPRSRPGSASSAASSSQTANSAQRRRSALSVIVSPAPRAEQPPEAQPGRRAAAPGGPGPCARMPRGAAARG